MKRLLRLLRTLPRRPLVQHKGISSIWMLPCLLKLPFSAHFYIFLFKKWIRLERFLKSTILLQTETMRPPPKKKEKKEKRKTYLNQASKGRRRLPARRRPGAERCTSSLNGARMHAGCTRSAPGGTRAAC